ncbi:MAG TPA: glycosyltransferase family 4 protein [Gemmatimonadaceae bacterium]|nr:glycosyltransferase family 4 protein [Gemmatimonadaceae bacterium]
MSDKAGAHDLSIGYLIQDFPPEGGAGPARAAEMSARWMARGAQVSVVTGMPNRRLAGRADGDLLPEYRGRLFAEEQRDGVRVLRSWAYTSTRKSFARTMINNATFMASATINSLMKLGTPDVLIASSPPFLPHLAGFMVGRSRRIPLVLEIRDLWPDYLVGMGILKAGSAPARSLFGLERLLLSNAAHIVVVTESFRQRVISKGVGAHKVSVISNGVDATIYRPEESRPPIKALERENGDFVAGYLGTFGAGQALSTIADAAAILAREAPSVRVVLVGEGPDWNRVKSHADSLSLPNLVVERSIDRDKTRAFYNSLDVCLIPLAPVSIFQETVPSKIFEAMACGRPVLASLAGEAEAIVKSSGGGITVQPGDANAIARGILKLRAMSAAERAAMGKKGREYVLANYRRETLADRYLDVLYDVASQRSTRAVKRPAMRALS